MTEIQRSHAEQIISAKLAASRNGDVAEKPEAHSKKCEAVFGIKCASKHKVKAGPLIQIKVNPL